MVLFLILQNKLSSYSVGIDEALSRIFALRCKKQNTTNLQRRTYCKTFELWMNVMILMVVWHFCPFYWGVLKEKIPMKTETDLMKTIQQFSSRAWLHFPTAIWMPFGRLLNHHHRYKHFIFFAVIRMKWNFFRDLQSLSVASKLPWPCCQRDLMFFRLYFCIDAVDRNTIEWTINMLQISTIEPRVQNSQSHFMSIFRVICSQYGTFMCALQVL